MSFDRRHFLQGGFLIGAHSSFGHPLLRLIEAITNDSIRQTLAADAGMLPRNYINVAFGGGPLRFAFDGWLRTNDSDPALVFNPMTATKFVSSGGTVTDVTYETMKYKGLNVPYIFSQSVQITSGMVPLTNYLDQMLVIRGYGTNIDGHPQNFNAQLKPLAGQPSISGLAADNSSAVFQAVRYPDTGLTFASTAGVALNTLGGGTPIASLMAGINSPAKTRALRAQYSAAMDAAKAHITAVASTQTKNAALARKSLDSAMALIKKGAGDIDGFWNEAFTRYNNIIRSAMHTTGIVGINDKPVITQVGSSQMVRNQIYLTDLSVQTVDPSQDACAIFTGTEMGNLAEGLALAEYVYGNNLVTSLELAPQVPTNVNFTAYQKGALTNKAAVWDMHLTGANIGLLQMNSAFRGLMAGLLELRDRLSAKTGPDGNSVWSNTLVQIMGDFNRSCRPDGSGADHGFNQMVTSLFSGVFDGPEVVGNVVSENPNSGYTGSQGYGAPIAGYNQSGIPNTAAMASTVSVLMNVPNNPWQNTAQPLIDLKGRTIVPKFGRGKVVA